MPKGEYVQAREEFLDNLGLTGKEKEFIDKSYSVNGPTANQSRIIAEFYVAKTLEDVTDRMIESNRKLAESNDRYAKRTILLSFAIFVAAAIQAIAMVVSVLD